MTGTETNVFQEAREKFDALVSRTDELQELYEGTCEILNSTIPTHNWVGIYLVEGSDLVLAAWRGPAPTEHVRIPIGYGLCGYAAEHAESIIVNDVSEDSRYLQCFSTTKSEIVVPIMYKDEVLGEIDVDGDDIDNYGSEDQELLEDMASRLGETIVRKSS
jgi:L-methionine (R)-S-oxide reductase